MSQAHVYPQLGRHLEEGVVLQTVGGAILTPTEIGHGRTIHFVMFPCKFYMYKVDMNGVCLWVCLFVRRHLFIDIIFLIQAYSGPTKNKGPNGHDGNQRAQWSRWIPMGPMVTMDSCL